MVSQTIAQAMRSQSGADPALTERICTLAQMKPRAVTLRQLFQFGSNPCPETVLTAARFLHQELPVRLAHRVKELEALPLGLSEMPSVRLVRDMYLESTHDLMLLPHPKTAADEARFTETIEAIKQRHNNVVSLMATGIQELKQSLNTDDVGPAIQDFLDRFYLSRIGIRMLIGEHIALHQGSKPGYVGLICERCSPEEVAQEAVANARNLCQKALWNVAGGRGSFQVLFLATWI